MYGCWLHGLSKLIEDIFGLPFFKALLDKHKLIVRKVRKKQWLHSSLLLHQKSDLLEPYYTDQYGRFKAPTVKRMGYTRMGSAYGMFKRNMKLSHAFAAIAADPAYNKKCGISNARAAAAEVAAAEAEAEAEEEGADDGGEGDGGVSASDNEDGDGNAAPTAATSAAKKQQDYLTVKSLMKDEEFIEMTKAAIEFVRPMMQVLRVADKTASQHAIVWERMASLDEHYSELVDTYKGPIPAEQVEATHEFVVGRWAYMHDSTHSVAYALNSHFHSRSIDMGAKESVMADLEVVFAEFYSGPEDQIKVGLEFQDYKSKGKEHWKKPLVWAQAEHMSPWQFWNTHGHCSPFLRPVAMVLSVLSFILEPS